MVSTGEARTEPDLTQLRYEAAYRLLGPVFADYLAMLDEQIRLFAEIRGAKVLFVARAGIRIMRLYEAYLARAGRPRPDGLEHLWMSRLLAIKGTWASQPAEAEAVMARQFEHTSVAEAVRAVFAPFDPPGSEIGSRDLARRPGSEFATFLHGRSGLARATRAQLERCGRDLDRYLEGLVGQHRTVLLADSGWQGTAQTLLTGWRRGIDWHGVYFGKMGTPESDRRYWSFMRGLVFEADAFDPSSPETALVLHHHLVEDLLEPDGPTIEHLERDPDGRMRAPGSEALLADAPGLNDDPMFCGVLDYVLGLPAGVGRGRLSIDAKAAKTELARRLAFPTHADALLLGGQRRSHDLGRSGHAAVLIDVDSDSRDAGPEDRLRRSLWQPAQAAMEYDHQTALARQRMMIGLDGPSAIGRLPVASRNPEDDAPLVAVITRTMDRPRFLERAMRSVSSQTMHDYEHVVVCDGGDIEMVARVVADSAADPRRTRILDTITNRGMESASNIAIRSSRSRYIVIHDDDDAWDPGFLEATVGYLQSPTGMKYDGVVSRTWQVSEEVSPEGIRIRGQAPYRDDVQRIELAEMAVGNLFPPIAFVFSRQAYERIGGFDETLPVLGDWDFNLRFLARYDIGMIPRRLAYYHIRDVGERGLFGNSVTAGADKHAEYTAIVRNRLMREGQNQDDRLAWLMGLGYAVGHLRSGHGPAGAASSSRAATAETAGEADVRWAIATAVGGQRFGPMLARRWPRAANRLLSDPFLLKLVMRVTPGRRLGSPPDFDERAYLSANPDVAIAVRDRHYPSGFAHYVLHGRRENRVRPGLDKGAVR